MTITANVADVKNKLSEFLSQVADGDTVIVCKRNVPVAKIEPVLPARRNKTAIGRGKGTVKVRGDWNEPVIPAAAWNCIKSSR